MALSSVLVSTGILVAIYGLLALGLNLKFGYNGLLDIGHVAFFMIGAYVTALLVLQPPASQQFATYILGWNLPWVVAVPIAVAVTGLAGMLVALPAIRLREDYLAIAVLGISVILKRTIQTEGWLANGPDALKGWSNPLSGFFPMPPAGTVMAANDVVHAVLGVVLFGLVVATLWIIGTYVLATIYDGPPTTNRDRAVHGLLAFTSLGVGYGAVRTMSGPSEDPGIRVPAAVGALFGLLATVMAALGVGDLATSLFVGFPSLFTWVAGGLLAADHYDHLTTRDAAGGFLLALAFLGVFLPLIVMSGGVRGQVALVATGVLLAAFLAGLWRLSTRWEHYGDNDSFVSVVGFGALSLFLLRYFVLSLIVPFKQSGAAVVVNNLLQNLLWLLQFTAAGVEFDYSRFLFVLVLAALVGSYYLMEVTASSPFGRVLKAIREDEDVARALGKDTFSFKVQSMIIGSALAGLAGAFFIVWIGAINHSSFAPRVTFVVFLMVIIGGTANNRGVILGAVIYWVFQKGTEDIASFVPPENRASVQALRLAFIGALLVVILYYRPEGLWGEETVTSTEADG